MSLKIAMNFGGMLPAFDLRGKSNFVIFLSLIQNSSVE
jgi:hypothetical protein